MLDYRKLIMKKIYYDRRDLNSHATIPQLMFHSMFHILPEEASQFLS